MLPFKYYADIFDGDYFTQLENEIDFKQEMFNSKGDWILEPRKTSWMSDDLTNCLEYSNKKMYPNKMSPTIKKIQTILNDKFNIYFDSVLANYYPDGKSAMRYHSDPINKWDTNFMVISFGIPRKFIFRRIDNYKEKHEYNISNGDCIHMFNKCQDLYQHCIKRDNSISLPRISLVFKRLKSNI